MCGFAVSLMWPGIFSLSAEKFPKGGTAMFGILAIGGDIGAAVGPWIAGVVSDLTQSTTLAAADVGLKMGLLVSMIFPIVLIIGILLLKNKKVEV